MYDITTGSSIKNNKEDLIFSAINYTVLSIIFIIVMYPIIYVVSASFSDPEALMVGRVWLFPVNPGLEGYKVTFSYNNVWTGFGNSFFYAIFGTLINVALTIMAAYPLSRRDFFGGGVITFIFAFTMWFSGGLIPTYILVKDLHMLDSRWALLIPSAMSVWNMIIARTYFQTNIPGELLEAARIDGCDDFSFLGKIVIPLSGPIIAVISLFYFVSHWNSYFSAFLYLSNRKLFPLQIILREILVMNQAVDMLSTFDLKELEKRERMSELLKYSLIVVSSLPVIAIYPFVQRFFIKGMMIGAIKG